MIGILTHIISGRDNLKDMFIAQRQQIFWLIEPEAKPSKQIIAGGFILPDGQVAIVRIFPHSSHATFPSWASFQELQNQRGRKLIFGQNSLDNYQLQSFQLVRDEDITGISGIGVVAVGCYFQMYPQDISPDCTNIAVMQWLKEPKSTAWYPQGWEQIKLIHGHKGKTKIVID
jgi:hypothetical protein